MDVCGWVEGHDLETTRSGVIDHGRPFTDLAVSHLGSGADSRELTAPPMGPSEVGPPWFATTLKLAGTTTPPPLVDSKEEMATEAGRGEKRREGSRVRDVGLGFAGWEARSRKVWTAG